jgi:hypothetical protein
MKDRFLFRRALVESATTRPEYNFHGTKEELRALVDVIAATRMFESTLMDDSKSLGEITEALKRKHVCARAFEHVFGTVWPL